MAETEIDRTNAARAKQLSTLDSLAQKFGDSLSKAFISTVGPAKQLDGALNSLVAKLAGMAGKAVLDPVKSGIESLVRSLINSGASSTAFAKGGVISSGVISGGVISGGRVRPFAEGGVVAAPTYFPLRDGTGLMGEAGPEAILPLTRGSDGRLGVAGGAAGRPVSVTVHIATPDAESFRRSEAQVAAALARAVSRGRRAS
ncbi:phage tail tape measure protein [Methylobacterium sp. W2]|uniref:phage tail tape measure protein n=1 Tax=Methylobacterium sp. W2 TaxID=2598107 RepID=UPI001D0CBADB|nr:phage tail tape measure protein [Methylobacterium sp. W2]MCC0809139.1 phage tail tape measure protein [Methylobacterium sp. W2]